VRVPMAGLEPVVDAPVAGIGPSPRLGAAGTHA
jgi:hypothetical protein